MNVALAYYNALDDYEDEGKTTSKMLCQMFGKELVRIRETYPRQCEAIETGIRELKNLEKENCSNPDEPAGCFGKLMGELLVSREDLWAEDLRQLGFYLGRFIYLANAVMDRKKDLSRGSYNPLPGDDPQVWENYLVMAMGRCCEHFQRLPLVQDKAVLDNILYSGVWVRLKQKNKRRSRG
jgi:hypothetical protein